MKYLLAVVCAITSVSSYAQESSGAYMGFGVGSFDYAESDAASGISLSDNASAYRLFGGYRFSENFSVEGGWGATGDLKDTVTATLPGFGTMSFDTAADFEVLTVRALGRLPFDNVALFGGVGYYDSEVDVSVSVQGIGEVGSGSGSDSGATIIGGLEFAVSRVNLRAEYEWFDTDSSVDASMLGLGLFFNF